MNSHTSPPLTAMKMVVAPASDHPGGLDLENLVSFLQDQTKIPIQLYRCANYEEAMAALADGSAQLGWLGPVAYKEAADAEGNIEAFAVGVQKGKSTPNYTSIFIVRPESEIKILSDVRNQAIALGDSHSASGYGVPSHELSEAGIDIQNEAAFKEIIRVGNHDEAIRAVLEGRVDVAPVSSVNLEEMVASGTITSTSFRIIHQSPGILGAPLVLSSAIDQPLKEQLKTLVLDAHNHIDVGGYGGPMDRYIDPEESHKNLLESYLRPQWGWPVILSIVVFLSVYAVILIDLEVNPAQLIGNSINYIGDIVGRMMPPDFSKFDELMLSMLETIEIAMLGTLLAILLSIPVGLFSAHNIAPNYPIYLIARTITIFFRAIPEFIMAMILVIAIGFGAMPGVLALGFHTMGFLAKFYAEAIEHVSEDPMEALESMGASRRQVIAFAVVPQIMASFVGNNLYILDRNIRMATMLGIVGAGGIGYELQSSFRMFNYPRVSAIIIIIFVTIFFIDKISSYIRSKAI
jgi:phosphonate transport system permease protein